MNILFRALIELERRGRFDDERRARMRERGFEVREEWVSEPTGDGNFRRGYYRRVVPVDEVDAP